MTRFLMAGLALVMMIAGSGCVNTCRQCNGGRQGLLANHGGRGDQCRNGLCNRDGRGQGGGGGGAGAGVGGAQVAYPYYTVRAPRDFLDPNPRGIGP
jgi:hypothetical protein